MHKKTFFIGLGIYFIVLIGFLIFDFSLELGKFSGLVFFLWSLYFSVAYIIVTSILAFIFRKKKKHNIAKTLLYNAGIGIVAIILLFVGSAILQ